MKATRQLPDLGQSVWLDNITRTLLDDETLATYIAENSITGLTSNPSIFGAAIGGGTCDAAIQAKTLAAKLQQEGAHAFVKSWQQLLQRIAEKSHALEPARA